MRPDFIESGLLSGFPDEGTPALTVFEREGDHVVEGVLTAPNGNWYPIVGGVPRYIRGDLRGSWNEFAQTHGLTGETAPAAPSERDTAGQKKTTVTFSDKWRRFQTYGLEPSHREFLFEWYCQKLGLASVRELQDFYASKTTVLEVGPGSGFNSRFMSEHCRGTVVAADISDAALTTYKNTQDRPNCHVTQSDLMDLPFADGVFDFIIADGVLHHTPDTRAAVDALYRKLAPGGQFFFYVYRAMGPARQFCDEHVRKAFVGLEPEACYEACEALTELGRELSRLDASITLSKPVEVLGIPAGTHDVQRLIYYNFVKCFWNEAFDFETNNMVNFDWYHPHHAWQHTEEEVAGWLDALGVREYGFNDANPNGICALLTKPTG